MKVLVGVEVMLPHTFCRANLGRTVCFIEEGRYFVLALHRILYIFQTMKATRIWVVNLLLLLQRNMRGLGADTSP